MATSTAWGERQGPLALLEASIRTVKSKGQVTSAVWVNDGGRGFVLRVDTMEKAELVRLPQNGFSRTWIEAGALRVSLAAACVVCRKVLLDGAFRLEHFRGPACSGCRNQVGTPKKWNTYFNPEEATLEAPTTLALGLVEMVEHGNAWGVHVPSRKLSSFIVDHAGETLALVAQASGPKLRSMWEASIEAHMARVNTLAT